MIVERTIRTHEHADKVGATIPELETAKARDRAAGIGTEPGGVNTHQYRAFEIEQVAQAARRPDVHFLRVPEGEIVLPIGTDLSPDAEVGTNAYGGKSSKLAARFDLLDRDAIKSLTRKAHDLPAQNNLTDAVDATIGNIYWFLGTRRDDDLEYVQLLIHDAVALSLGRCVRVHRDGHINQFSALSSLALFRLAEVLGYGAAKYAVNNWRAVSVDEHLNHALTHLFAYEGGDKQDDHLGHAFCRIHMALAVQYQGEPWVVIDGVPQPKPAEKAA